MPAVVAGALVSAVGLTGVVGTVATALVGAGASFALQSLSGKSSKPKTTLDAGRRIELIRDANAPRRVVYGRARVSGPLIFTLTTPGLKGEVNGMLHLAIPLATHEVAAIGDLYVNDELVPPTAGAQGWIIPPKGNRYYNPTLGFDGISGKHYIQWRTMSGTTTQQVEVYMQAYAGTRWTYPHRLAGIAYVYCLLLWNSTVWAGGLPNLSFIVDGKPLYDPRTGNTAWSNNPALVIRDYLLSSWGLSCVGDEIDEASFIAAANLCDESVPTGAGTQQKRYTCDGVISLDEKPIDVMEKLLSSCGGSLVYSQGRYRLYPAAYRSPAQSLDASMLRDSIRVRPVQAQKERVNTVRGSFVDPARGWQNNDFPPVSNASYVAADGGEIVKTDIELPFTTDVYTAQRLARLQLERARRHLTVEAPMNLSALDVAVMEPVKFTVPALGWEDKVLTPVEWNLAADGGVDLVLVEDDPALYAWSGGTSSDPALPVLLPNIYPDPPMVTVTDSLVASGGGGSIYLYISINSDTDAFINRYETEYRLAGATDWIAAGGGASVSVPGVREGDIYEVRARGINMMGLTSPWSSVTHQVLGTAQPPGDISSLTATLIDTNLTLEWTAAQGLISRYRLRWSPDTSSATWSSAVDVSATITNTRAVVPARVGTYMVKAVDALGRESVNPASAVNLIADPTGLNAVASLTEHPGFSGAKTNCVVNVSNQLIIDSLVAFDAQAGNFDSGSGNFDVAGGGSNPEGVYAFSGPIDLSQTYIARVSAAVKVSVLDLVTDFEGVAGTFDTREGFFDGDAPSAVDVVLEVATTTGDPAGSPTWSGWQKFSVGDVTARGLKFRARLTTTNAMATPAVEQLKVSVDMPDRIAAGADVVSVTTGTTITFSPAFKATPSITITPQNMATGDYWTITSKSRTGFTVQFKNAAGTGISRTFDWTARGYGRQQ